MLVELPPTADATRSNEVKAEATACNEVKAEVQSDRLSHICCMAVLKSAKNR